MRFYDVNAGSVCVEEQDIRHVTRHSLRENYGMVLQDTWLQAGTFGTISEWDVRMPPMKK